MQPFQPCAVILSSVVTSARARLVDPHARLVDAPNRCARRRVASRVKVARRRREGERVVIGDLHSFQPETTMRALARQTSELDALDAHIANSVASAEDVVGEDGVATATVTPAKGVRTLTVKTARDDADGEGDAARKRAKNAFSIALEEEIEHMHDRECATPATTASAVPLHAAVARGDAAAARALAPGRVDVGGGDEGEGEGEGAGANWPPSKGPLERISSYDDVQMRRREIGLDARNEHGDTALVVACALEDGESCAEMVKILVDAGADLHAVSNGYAAVHWACRFGHVEAVAYMVNASKARGETVRVEDIRAGDGSTPLLVAAEYGQMDVIRWLLVNTSVNAMTRDAQGRDVLAALGSKMRRQSQSAKRDLRADMFALVPSLRLALISHPDCEEHVSLKPHQESPERILAIFEELERVTQRGELEAAELEKVTAFDAADPHEILRAHSEEYVRVLAKLSDQVGGTPIAFTPYCQNQKGVPEKFQKPAENSDTFFSPGTLQAALRAAGGVIHAVNRVIKGENRSAFVCCRPPGHHAGVNGATDGAPSSGFSILNNAMIGALHAIDQLKCMRVAVVDFDVHHGNGTEEIARHWIAKRRASGEHRSRASPDLFFASIHLADDGTSSGINFYPGTGVRDDLVNNIVNVVVPPMWLAKGATAHANAETGERARKKTKRFSDSDETAPKTAAKTTDVDQHQGGRLEWVKAFRERLIPALRAFGPELIVVSAGFDAAASDVGNLGVDPKRNTRHQGVNLRPEDYEDMTKSLVNVANVCDSRVVSILEGGYGHLVSAPGGKDDAGTLTLARDGFARCVRAHVKALT